MPSACAQLACPFLIFQSGLLVVPRWRYLERVTLFYCRRNSVAILLGAAEELGMRVSIDERLTRLCADFSVAKIGEWLERKFASYDTSKQDVISIAENKNDKEYFRLFCKL